MPVPRPVLLLVGSVTAVLVAASAQAEPKVYETDVVRVNLKPARPLVTELATPQKNLASAQSKQPVANKIESAVASGPF
jgi:hypothetical protein